jgi:hypothetical protein
MMPMVLRDPGVGRTLDEYYVEAGMGMKIKIRLAEVLREGGSKEYCCFADIRDYRRHEGLHNRIDQDRSKV